MNKIFLPLLDEDLLNECTIFTYRTRGSNGQHMIELGNAIRLTHNPSGIVIKCQAHCCQDLNRQDCLAKLREEVDRRNYRKPKQTPSRIPHAFVVKNRAKKIKELEKKSAVSI